MTERLDVSGRTIVAARSCRDGANGRGTGRRRGRGAGRLPPVVVRGSRARALDRRARPRARYPGRYVSISSEVAPLLGEYERCVSTAFNSYIGPAGGRVSGQAGAAARLALGMACSLLVMQSQRRRQPGGGGPPPPHPHPRLGPGRRRARRRGTSRACSGCANVICTDVGGTTFDVGLVFAERVQMDPRPVIDQYAYLMPKIYVKSIGAGGGSIAWIDDGGSLRVGPRSAGSHPGPACLRAGRHRADGDRRPSGPGLSRPGVPARWPGPGSTARRRRPRSPRWGGRSACRWLGWPRPSSRSRARRWPISCGR